MSLQSWFDSFEILSAIGAALVIRGLILEYGKGLFGVLKWWERSHLAEIEVETLRKRRGAVLVVIGIVVEFIGTAGVAVTSDRIETHHQQEVSDLNNQLAVEIAERNEKVAALITKVAEAFQPRTIGDDRSLVLSLTETTPPQSVLIQHVSDDEARATAEQLAWLIDFGRRHRPTWNPKFVTEADTCMSRDVYDDGIHIYVHEGSPVFDDANRLKKYLDSRHVESVVIPLPARGDNQFLKFDLAKDEIFIFVGRKPPPNIESLLPPEFRSFNPGRYSHEVITNGQISEPTAGQTCRSTLKK